MAPLAESNRWKKGLLALALAAMIVPFATLAFAHRGRHPHRHPHRRARLAIVVARPVVLAAPVVIQGQPHGVIDFDVDPSDTEVIVDGTTRGTADDFDGHPQKMNLLPGVHKVTLRTPEGDEVTKKVKVVAGQEMTLSLDLEE
jgi:hypothetical protein